MDRITSADGTSLAFDRTGSGPAVVLVCGGSTDRTTNAGLAAALSSDFTVYNFDRRGRGDSGDTLPYAIAREIEDIEAVVAAAGGEACAWGSSSGGALVLHAAAAGAAGVTKIALWEPPYIPDGVPRPPANTAQVYRDFVAEGRPDAALEYFMTRVVGMPPEFVAGMKQSPWWAAGEKLAPTLAYDAEIMDDYVLPTDLAASVHVPALVVAGGADMPWMPASAQALAAAIPGGRFHHLEGQGHNVDMAVLAPVLAEFFAG